MNFSDERKYNRWFIIFAGLAVIVLVLWNTTIFFNRLKDEERTKMSIWAEALLELDRADSNENLSPLILNVLNSNTSIPTLQTDEEGTIVSSHFIDPEKIDTPEKAENYLNRLKAENEPIIMHLDRFRTHKVYYGNSPVLNSLKYYPLGLVTIGFLIIGVIYFFYTTTKNSEQNKLWAGMAKETAHQIGTPLSSLIGWTEILKQEKVNDAYIVEMEKDIQRLQTITERFSKIGSAPLLEETDLVEATRQSYQYLQSRSSKLIEFQLQVPREKIIVNLNTQLFSWTIENLVKNGIDAMRGKGKITIEIKQNEKQVFVYVHDTGKGIDKSRFKIIFEPGQTTKKRGWGLGLSLAKRIVEEYHNGRIRVAKSEIGEGTTFEIMLKKSSVPA